MSISLHGSGRSRSFRALWALEELRLDFTYVPIDFRAGDARSPAYLKLNPGSKVPTLVDDGRALTESGAILAWLGDRYGDGALVPRAGTWARACYDRWSYFAVTELEQPLWSIGKHRFALPRDWRVPAMLETAPKEFARATALLSEGLGEQPWILGETFTFADVLLIHTLEWAKRFEVPAAEANLDAYRLRGLARPGYQRALARLG
ncbi:MAG: glutathione S-transferase family protein [Alphaproteobacteria bacterium]|nr:glutathione S-transferase family protein [Alphaproteobacteria bacterium]